MQSIIVGLLLGDAWLEKAKINARFRFEQSHIRTEFFMDVYKYFIFYCKSEARLRERFDKRTNKIYKTWHFSTLSSCLFTNYYYWMYPEGKKIVPKDINKYLDSVALSYWIMCDGYKRSSGLALATNSYTIEDNNLLINVLNEKFGFNSWLVSDHNQPTIFIPKRNMPLLQKLVSPYIHSTLLYKIYLK
jgi:hypothetical protein